MKRLTRAFQIAAALLLICGLGGPALAGEHPGDAVTKEEEAKVQKAAKVYIDARVKEKGAFQIYDDKDKRDRKLAFDFFHKVTKLDGGDYFFCSDFTEGKDRLDLDFRMSEDLEVDTVVIHKVNGKKRK